MELYTSEDQSSGFTRWDLIFRSFRLILEGDSPPYSIGKANTSVGITGIPANLVRSGFTSVLGTLRTLDTFLPAPKSAQSPSHPFPTYSLTNNPYEQEEKVISYMYIVCLSFFPSLAPFSPTHRSDCKFPFKVMKVDRILMRKEGHLPTMTRMYHHPGSFAIHHICASSFLLLLSS